MDDNDDEPGRRNVSSTCSDIFLEKLIEKVKKYPCLYAVHSLQYRDVAAKERCWNEIAKHSNLHSSALKKEWKKLRDCYRQALVTRTRNDSKKKNLRPWKFETQMEFLKPYITPRSRHLDGSQTSSESEFDPNSVVIKQEPTSDDDNPDMTVPHTNSTQSEVATPTRLLRSRVGQTRPPPSPKPPRKRSKKNKSPTSSNDISTSTKSIRENVPSPSNVLVSQEYLSFATSTSTVTNGSEADRASTLSTSSQGKEPHISSTSIYDNGVEADSSQEKQSVTTIASTVISEQLKTSFPIVANILENNILPAVTTTIETNTPPNVTTTPGNNTPPNVTTTPGNNTPPNVTTTPGNNTLATVTTTLENNILPTVTVTLVNNTLPPGASTFGNSTKANNSLPINTNTHVNNILLPTTTSTLGNSSRLGQSFPIYGSKFCNYVRPQTNSTLGNNAHSLSSSSPARSNMQPCNILQQLNRFFDSKGQPHNIITPVPTSTVGNYNIDGSIARPVCNTNNSRPPIPGNSKAPKPISYSQFVDIISNSNQCQLFKLTPATINAVGNNNLQQENSMDTSSIYNVGNKNNDHSKSASSHGSNYDPPSTDSLNGNINNGRPQSDGTFGNGHHPQSVDACGHSAHPQSISALGNSDHPQSIGSLGNSDHPQSIGSLGNSDHPQSIGYLGNNHPQYTGNIRNDDLASDRALGNTSFQKFSVSSQTTSSINNSQMHNLIPSSIGNNYDSHEHSALQLFFASMYESTKQLPMKYQNTIKKDLFESVMSAEKKHYTY